MQAFHDIQGMTWHAGYPVRLFSGLYTRNTEPSKNEGIFLPFPTVNAIASGGKGMFCRHSGGHRTANSASLLIEEPDHTSNKSGGSWIKPKRQR